MSSDYRPLPSAAASTSPDAAGESSGANVLYIVGIFGMALIILAVLLCCMPFCGARKRRIINPRAGWDSTLPVFNNFNSESTLPPYNASGDTFPPATTKPDEAHVPFGRKEAVVPALPVTSIPPVDVGVIRTEYYTGADWSAAGGLVGGAPPLVSREGFVSGGPPEYSSTLPGKLR